MVHSVNQYGMCLRRDPIPQAHGIQVHMSDLSQVNDNVVLLRRGWSPGWSPSMTRYRFYVGVLVPGVNTTLKIHDETQSSKRVSWHGRILGPFHSFLLTKSQNKWQRESLREAGGARMRNPINGHTLAHIFRALCVSLAREEGRVEENLIPSLSSNTLWVVQYDHSIRFLAPMKNEVFDPKHHVRGRKLNDSSRDKYICLPMKPLSEMRQPLPWQRYASSRTVRFGCCPSPSSPVWVGYTSLTPLTPIIHTKWTKLEAEGRQAKRTTGTLKAEDARRASSGERSHETMALESTLLLGRVGQGTGQIVCL